MGKEGITDATIAALEDALRTRELLKAKVHEAAPISAREAADLLASRVPSAHAVQVIGRTVVLYRPDPEAPEIRLPK